ncbi:ferritin family protein [Methyloprofundus sedimenti]
MKTIVAHNRNEEKEHVIMLLEWIKHYMIVSLAIYLTLI